MKYEVTLHAKVQKTITVTADTPDKAESKAQKKFYLNANEVGECYTLHTDEVKEVHEQAPSDSDSESNSNQYGRHGYKAAS